VCITDICDEYSDAGVDVNSEEESPTKRSATQMEEINFGEAKRTRGFDDINFSSTLPTLPIYEESLWTPSLESRSFFALPFPDDDGSLPLPSLEGGGSSHASSEDVPRKKHSSKKSLRRAKQQADSKRRAAGRAKAKKNIDRVAQTSECISDKDALEIISLTELMKHRQPIPSEHELAAYASRIEQLFGPAMTETAHSALGVLKKPTKYPACRKRPSVP